MRPAVVLSLLVIACTKPAGSGPAEPHGSEVVPHEVGVGDAFPAFRRARVDGNGDVALPSGKPTVVAFLATWNMPAQKMVPQLEEYRKKHGVDVIGVWVDDEDGADNIRHATAEWGGTFPMIWDKDRALASKVQASHVPSTYFVDERGVVRWRGWGYREGTIEELEQATK